jgi:NitT/TauT family transport system ATP-binding protein
VEEALRLSDRVLVMGTQPGRIRKEFRVKLPHPRDFLDPDLAALRIAILQELKDEIDKVTQREGDDDWHLKKDSLGARPRGAVGLDMGDGI